jgi:hypothetical protein
MTVVIATVYMCRSDEYSEVNEERTHKEPLPRMFSADDKRCPTSGKIFLFFAAVDLIMVVGLTLAAARILMGKIAMSKQAAYRMLRCSGAIPLLWLTFYANYTYCFDLCLPSGLPKK